MRKPTVGDAVECLTDPNYLEAGQWSDSDPARINATRVRTTLYEAGATVDEAEALIGQALDELGAWKESEVLPPLEETRPTDPTPELVERFMVPRAVLRG